MGLHFLAATSRRWNAWRLLLPVLVAVIALAASPSAEPPPAAPVPSQSAEPLAIVVHRSNPADALTLGEIRKLFRGERRKWSHGRNVTVVMRNPGTPERASALRAIYAMDENEFARFFLHAEFIGEVLTPPKQLNSTQGVIRFVFNVPGAIGYVRLSEVDKSVKTLRIDGLAPGEPGYPLALAFEPAAPPSLAHAARD